LFSVKTKLLVAVGSTSAVRTVNVEIIDLSSTKTICQPLKNSPLKVAASVGTLGSHRKPIICGGYITSVVEKKCYSYYDGNWIEDHLFQTPRYHAAIVNHNDIMIVTG